MLCHNKRPVAKVRADGVGSGFRAADFYSGDITPPPARRQNACFAVSTGGGVKLKSASIKRDFWDPPKITAAAAPTQSQRQVALWRQASTGHAATEYMLVVAVLVLSLVATFYVPAKGGKNLVGSFIDWYHGLVQKIAKP